MEEIKQAYRSLALLWHPDRYPQDGLLQLEAEQKFKEISYAYNQLRFVSRLSQSAQPPAAQQENAAKSSPRSSQRNSPPYSQRYSHRQYGQKVEPPFSTTRPVSNDGFIPWGWLTGTLIGYGITGGILEFLGVPGWAWMFTWFAWFAIALTISSSPGLQQSWFMVLMVAGGAAGWIAGHIMFQAESPGLLASLIFSIVGIALGAIAASDASTWLLIWAFTVSGILVITGCLVGASDLSIIGFKAFVGGIIGMVVGVLLGIASDAMFKSRSRIGAGRVFGFWFGGWYGTWVGAGGSKVMVPIIGDIHQSLVFGAWGAIAVVAGVVAQMVAGEKLTESWDEFATFLILLGVSSLGLLVGSWLVKDAIAL